MNMILAASSEELKLIADTITSLGKDGKEAFIYYLIATPVRDVVNWSFVIVLAWIIIRAVAKSVKESDDNARAIKNLRDLAGIGAPGEMTGNERNSVVSHYSQLERTRK